MSTPPDLSTLEDYFARLRSALKRMPAAAREEHERELRQHLDALVAAHEELGASPAEAVSYALAQMGDPARIGKQLYREWRRPAPDTAAVSVCLRWLLLTTTIVFFAATRWPVLFPGAVLFGVPLLAGAATGLWTPRFAVKGVFWSVVAFAVPPLMLALGLAFQPADHSALPRILLWVACWMGTGLASAYTVSALRRREWYHVSLSNLKLTSLKRARH